MRSAPDDARLVSLLGDHREPEVGQLGHVAGGHQHVGRLDVAVDHPLVMCVVERLGHLGQDSQPFSQRQFAPPFRVTAALQPPP